MTSSTADSSRVPAPLRVALNGYSFMGPIHAHAWTTAPRFFDLGTSPVLAAVCGRNPEAAGRFAEAFGIARVETGWRRLVEDPKIGHRPLRRPGSKPAVPAAASGAR